MPSLLNVGRRVLLLLVISSPLALSAPGKKLKPASDTKDIKTPPSELHKAAFGGNVALIKRLIANGAPIEKTYNNKETPLHFAAKEGQADAIKALLEAGANIKAKTGPPESATALHMAVQDGKVEAVEALLAAGASVKAKAGGGFQNGTPLQCVSRPLSHCGPMSVYPLTSRIGSSLASLAAVKGFDRVIKALLAAGADPNAKADHGATPLHWAANTGRVDSIEALAEGGANVMIKDDTEKLTPLQKAQAAGNHPDAIYVLKKLTKQAKAKAKAAKQQKQEV